MILGFHMKYQWLALAQGEGRSPHSSSVEEDPWFLGCGSHRRQSTLDAMKTRGVPQEHSGSAGPVEQIQNRKKGGQAETKSVTTDQEGEDAIGSVKADLSSLDYC
jgi:hypothetical protein